MRCTHTSLQLWNRSSTTVLQNACTSQGNLLRDFIFSCCCSLWCEWEFCPQGIFLCLFFFFFNLSWEVCLKLGHLCLEYSTISKKKKKENTSSKVQPLNEGVIEKYRDVLYLCFLTNKYNSLMNASCAPIHMHCSPTIPKPTKIHFYLFLLL